MRGITGEFEGAGNNRRSLRVGGITRVSLKVRGITGGNNRRSLRVGGARGWGVARVRG